MQYCRKCGHEMTDDSVFCPKCGEKIVVSKKNEVIHVDTNNKVKRNLEVNVKSLNNLGVKDTAFANRIDSTEDANINDHLFTLYKKLINPVKKIEGLTDKIEQCNYEIEERKKLRYVWPDWIRALILSVILSIVLSAIHIVLEKPFIPEWDNHPEMYQEYHDSFSLYFAKEGPIWLKPSSYVLSIYDFVHPMDMDFFGVLLTIILFFMAQGFVYVYPLLCLESFVIYQFRKIVNKRAIHKLENNISDATGDRKEIILKIKDYICYVPPAYRTSDAIRYFVNSYENTRVGNLKEAVNAYDVYLNNNEMKAMINHACSELRNIQTLQLMTMDQLANINASVWAANAIF